MDDECGEPTEQADVTGGKLESQKQRVVEEKQEVDYRGKEVISSTSKGTVGYFDEDNVDGQAK